MCGRGGVLDVVGAVCGDDDACQRQGSDALAIRGLDAFVHAKGSPVVLALRNEEATQ